LYKPGYRLLAVKGQDEEPRSLWERLNFSAEETREAWWNQRMFALVRESTVPDLQRRERLDILAALRDCKWIRMPRIATAYVSETKRTRSSRSFEDPTMAQAFSPRRVRKLFNR
jgi:hypothetical protein